MSALGNLLGALAGAGTFPLFGLVDNLTLFLSTSSLREFESILKLVDIGGYFSLVLNWIGFSILLSLPSSTLFGREDDSLVYLLCYPILGLMGTCVELCARWHMTAATLLRGGTCCSVGFTLVARVGGEGCTEHPGNRYEFFPAWTVGPSTTKGSIGGATCDNWWINLDSGADLCLTVVGDVWSLDIERSLLLEPLESGPRSFYQDVWTAACFGFWEQRRRVWARSW
eukprot:g7054.t1